MSDKTLGEKLKTWWPILVTVAGLIGASFVDAYRLAQAETAISGKVDSDIYQLQTASADKAHKELSEEISKVKAEQETKEISRLREKNLKLQLENNSKAIDKLDKKMDNNFNEIKDLLRGTK